MPKLVSATGNTLRNALAAARRELNLPLHPTGEVVSYSDSGDGLYRVVLRSKDVIEVTLQHGKGSTSSAHVQPTM